MDKKILKDVIYYLSDEQGFVASVIEKDFHLTRILNRVNEDLSTDIVFIRRNAFKQSVFELSQVERGS